MAKDLTVYTAEDRPVCKTADRCNGKMAALNKGVLCYHGFCSSCYQHDKTERRASESLEIRPGSGTDRASSTSAVSELQSGGDTDSSQPANKEDQRPKLASDDKPGRGPKRPPGGGGFPQPGPWPTEDEEVKQTSSIFGWCMTGHHEGSTDIDPDGRTGLLSGTFPILCPGTVWFSMQNHWASCPCQCHDSALEPEDVADQRVHESLVTA